MPPRLREFASNMHHSYLAFGLSIRSNRPINYLTQSPAPDVTDVTVEFRNVDEDREKPNGSDWDFGHPARPVRDIGIDIFHDGDRQKIRVYRPDSRYFEFVATADRVLILIPEDISDMDPVSFLLGPVISVVCRLRYQSSLHASVLAIDGRAFALIGDKGMGKSTTAAMLVKLGAQLVADDAAILCTINDEICVQPGYPFMRVSSDVMTLTGHDLENASPVLSVGDKYYVPAYSKPAMQKFLTTALPLERVYGLSGRLKNSSRAGVQTLQQSEALRHLIGNAHVPPVLNDRMRKIDFEHFAKLAREGRVMSTTRPDDLGQLEDFCSVLMHDFKSLDARG